MGLAIIGAMLLGAAVVVWRWRTERDAPTQNISINRHLNAPAYSALSNGPAGQLSSLERILGNLSPNLSDLIALSKISSTIQWKDGEGKTLSESERLAAIKTVLDQMDAEKPDSVLLHQLRDALEKAEGKTGFSEDSSR
jgi:hypothetical protein